MSPQHFQQLDLYHETLLDERIAAVTPYAWGVAEIELDERALDAGQVALRSFLGVLPRGTVLRFRSGEPEAPPARAIEHHFPPQREALEVYLAVPLERSGSANYARGELERGRSRYLVETRSVLDTAAPAREEGVEFARRNVQLLFGEEAREDYETLKVAEIIRDRAGKLCFAAPYVPPCLRMNASPFLSDGLRRVLAASVAKRRAVAEELRHRDRSSVEFSSDEVTRYLAMNALSGAIPQLKYLLDASEVAPAQAYWALVQFAGQLSAFSSDEDPATLPTYVHGDLRSTFEPLFARLLVLLGIAVANRVLTIALEARVDGMHIARLQLPELFKPGVRFVLAVQTSVPEHSAYELVPRVGKIASWSEIPRYLNAAVSTVPLAACTRPPREIPVRPGKYYFLVSTDGAVWRSVMHERTIAVHLPPPFDPKSTAVELFAIPQG